MDLENSQFLQLEPCIYCGRKFAEESLNRHETICQKTSRKRPVFNSSKQRDVKGLESKLPSTKKLKTFSKATLPSSTSRSTWRQKHEEFIQTVRAARGVTAALRQGKQLPPPPPAATNPDYIRCPHCMRRFNQTAAERHIAFCAEQAKRLSNKKALARSVTNQAANRASARQNYRPPLPQSGKKNTDVRSVIRYKPTTKVEDVQFTKNNKATSELGSRRSFLVSNRFPGQLPKWDASVDINTEEKQVTKTGLRPSSGVNKKTTKIGGNNRAIQQHSSKKTPVRKIAGKKEVYVEDIKSSTYNPQHGWSGGNVAIGLNKEDRVHKASRFQDNRQHDLTDHSEKSIVSFSNCAQTNSSNCGLVPSEYSNPRRNKANETSEPCLSRDPTLYARMQSSGSLKFCHECGSLYPVPNANFCCECGVKRILLNTP